MNFFTTEITEPTEKEPFTLTGKIIGAALEIHKALGPGLLESAYEACLIYELRLRKMKVESQKAMSVFYKDVMLDCGYRADLYTNELKSWFLATSAWQQISGLHSRLAIQQWSHPPDTKICAASLPNSQFLNPFVYTWV